MTLKATVQGASAEVWNGVAQTAKDIIQWQECPASELNDDSFLGRGQDGAFRLRPHRRVAGLGAVAPFQ
jgi:hypothetical protein